MDKFRELESEHFYRRRNELEQGFQKVLRECFSLEGQSQPNEVQQQRPAPQPQQQEPTPQPQPQPRPSPQ